jgi:hypothetical protein
MAASNGNRGHGNVIRGVHFIMKEISVAQLYGLYLDTLGRCGSDLRHQSDEVIEHQLFEEFDVGAHSFLHEDNLIKLRRDGYIDDQMLSMSKEVRRLWLTLEKKAWTISEIKTTREWQALFELCDRLRLIAQKRASE